MFVNQTCKSPTGLPLQILEESAGNTLQSHPLSPRVASKYRIYITLRNVKKLKPCRACKSNHRHDWHSHTTLPPGGGGDNSYVCWLVVMVFSVHLAQSPILNDTWKDPANHSVTGISPGQSYSSAFFPKANLGENWKMQNILCKVNPSQLPLQQSPKWPLPSWWQPSGHLDMYWETSKYICVKYIWRSSKYIWGLEKWKRPHPPRVPQAP